MLKIKIHQHPIPKPILRPRQCLQMSKQPTANNRVAEAEATTAGATAGTDWLNKIGPNSPLNAQRALPRPQISLNLSVKA